MKKLMELAGISPEESKLLDGVCDAAELYVVALLREALMGVSVSGEIERARTRAARDRLWEAAEEIVMRDVAKKAADKVARDANYGDGGKSDAS